MMLQLTPTQARLMEILQDGQPHPVAVLWAAIGDEQSIHSNLRVHIFHLKNRLEVHGKTIVAKETDKGTFYRIVRNLYDDE